MNYSTTIETIETNENRKIQEPILLIMTIIIFIIFLIILFICINHIDNKYETNYRRFIEQSNRFYKMNESIVSKNCNEYPPLLRKQQMTQLQTDNYFFQ
ncbi:LOW QUALITY PROTEIN: uncharacterized protein LOC142646412 [Dermatophagoides pteronyssinus]|uniref:LOW QUALITY PROTEIN: uncharacterized protein LOC142646412 n=1 Tax=Dermatophagoides pteronyssinus TaxID=6956 RepID=UPI003F676C6E